MSIKSKIQKAYKDGGAKKVARKSCLRAYSYLHNFFTRSVPLFFVQLTATEGKLIKKVQGSLMVLDLNDQGISQELAATGVHEKNSTEQIKKELTEGMTIIEIGANIGYYALIEADIIGEGGKIIAFEPSPLNMKLLKSNVLLNGYDDRFEFYQKAIGDHIGREDFYLVNKGNMSSFIERDEDGDIKNMKKIEVEMTTLDQFLQGRRVDYIRMDIEGYEFEAISGMMNLLRSEFAPKGFYIEVHSSLFPKRGKTAREFIDLMKSFGYEVKKAFWRGRADTMAESTEQILTHKLLEKGYWETFFRKIN